MNESARKVLLWLYGVELIKGSPVVSSEIKYLLPEYSPGGRRSLLSQMRKETLIISQQVAGTREYYLTSHGRKALQRQFPALSDELVDWQGQWSMLVFLTSPKSDPQFRYLRHILLKNRAGQLARGVYLYPGQFPDVVVQEEERYKGAFTIVATNRWLMGDERSIIVPIFSLSDAIDISSGISKESQSLLSNFETSNKSTDQCFADICLVFDRLLSLFDLDLGISHRYFPRVERSVELLQRVVSLRSI